ncbi:MAG: 1,4-alpha-glucan branching protein GlgB, partial [Frankiales bacterium]|nr:1,4-alpha-glucan branching protein GlgB [Frankiales bacterium]
MTAERPPRKSAPRKKAPAAAVAPPPVPTPSPAPSALTAPISAEVLELVAGGAHGDPHSVLGMHPGPDGVTIRALRPGA